MGINFKFDDDNIDYADDVYSKYDVLDRANLRCTLCNCVSSPDIADDLGENYTKATMVHDRRDPTKIVCTECLDIIGDSLEEF